MIREKLEAHAATCRKAGGYERPRWEGGSLAYAGIVGADLAYVALVGADLRRAKLTRANLTGADLRWACLDGADLTGADFTSAKFTSADLANASLTGADLTATLFRNADLNGADLTGARLDEGVACGRAIGGLVGGYRWFAVRLEDGNVLLQYGCERRLLVWWLAQGPDLCVRYGDLPELWERGPMVAIAAAQALASTSSP